MEYQVFFRLSRGGVGIPYGLARTEFLTVFNDAVVLEERSGKHRLWVQMARGPDAVAGAARRLGYTEGILLLRRAPYRGEALAPVRHGRWDVGWSREGDEKVHRSEVHVQDAEGLRLAAPNRRAFVVREGGQQFIAKGRRNQRAVSPLDARFLLNIAGPRSTDTVLDPFAGFGGIVSETVRRGLNTIASDLDASLSPGLATLVAGSHCVADARHLPLHTHSVDAVITEPPFRSPQSDAFLDSLDELLRVLVPHGQLLLLIKMDMLDALRTRCEALGLAPDLIGVIPRGGGMKCPVVQVPRGITPVQNRFSN